MPLMHGDFCLASSSAEGEGFVVVEKSLSRQILDLIDDKKPEEALGLLIENQDQLPGDPEMLALLLGKVIDALYEAGYDLDDLDELERDFGFPFSSYLPAALTAA